MLHLMKACEEMTEDGLATADDQVLGFLATMSEHLLTEDAYREIQRRQRMLKPVPFTSWADELKALKPKKRGKR